MIPVVPTIAEVRAVVGAARGQGRRIGLVPTMGALHPGHAALVRAAATVSDMVMVSVFVNPTQFGPQEDFARYPRTLDADRAIVAEAGGTAIFAPSVAEMYPAESTTRVEVQQLDQHLCGPQRPGHFIGVATVVLKLLNIVQPDVAVFGAKDAQQLRIIQRLVRDLNVPVEIVAVPTVRDTDGLALSSRNRYLSATERGAAAGIPRALAATQAAVRAGERDAGRLQAELFAKLSQIPGASVEYAQVLAEDTLQPVREVAGPVLIACAVRLGTTRLIDNVTAP